MLLKMNRKSLNYAFYICVVTLLIFAPVLFDSNVGTSVANVYIPQAYIVSIIATIAMMAPIMFNHIFDYFSRYVIPPDGITSYAILIPKLITAIVLCTSSSIRNQSYLLCFVFIQVFSSFIAVTEYSKKFAGKLCTVTFYRNFPILFCIGLCMNSFSHFTTKFYGSLFLVVTLLTFFAGSLYILEIYRRVSIIYHEDSFKYFCYIVCMISLFLLVLGCILLRLISLYAVDGMPIYINGLIILSSICTLPVFMLDGRIARYDAIKNEVC